MIADWETNVVFLAAMLRPSPKDPEEANDTVPRF
jgi:hypothetical protein